MKHVAGIVIPIILSCLPISIVAVGIQLKPESKSNASESEMNVATERSFAVPIQRSHLQGADDALNSTVKTVDADVKMNSNSKVSVNHEHESQNSPADDALKSTVKAVDADVKMNSNSKVGSNHEHESRNSPAPIDDRQQSPEIKLHKTKSEKNDQVQTTLNKGKHQSNCEFSEGNKCIDEKNESHGKNVGINSSKEPTADKKTVDTPELPKELIHDTGVKLLPFEPTSKEKDGSVSNNPHTPVDKNSMQHPLPPEEFPYDKVNHKPHSSLTEIEQSILTPENPKTVSSEGDTYVIINVLIGLTAICVLGTIAFFLRHYFVGKRRRHRHRRILIEEFDDDTEATEMNQTNRNRATEEGDENLRL